MDTGNSVGYVDTFERAILLATKTRREFGLVFNSVQIVRLGSPKKIKKKLQPKRITTYRTHKGHLKYWDE